MVVSFHYVFVVCKSNQKQALMQALSWYTARYALHFLCRMSFGFHSCFIYVLSCHGQIKQLSVSSFGIFSVIMDDFYNLFIYKRFERKVKIEVTNWQPCLFLRFAVSCCQCLSSWYKSNNKNRMLIWFLIKFLSSIQHLKYSKLIWQNFSSELMLSIRGHFV